MKNLRFSTYDCQAISPKQYKIETVYREFNFKKCNVCLQFSLAHFFVNISKFLQGDMSSARFLQSAGQLSFLR